MGRGSRPQTHAALGLDAMLEGAVPVREVPTWVSDRQQLADLIAIDDAGGWGEHLARGARRQRTSTQLLDAQRQMLEIPIAPQALYAAAGAVTYGCDGLVFERGNYEAQLTSGLQEVWLDIWHAGKPIAKHSLGFGENWKSALTYPSDEKAWQKSGIHWLSAAVNDLDSRPGPGGQLLADRVIEVFGPHGRIRQLRSLVPSDVGRLLQAMTLGASKAWVDGERETLTFIASDEADYPLHCEASYLAKNGNRQTLTARLTPKQIDRLQAQLRTFVPAA